MNVYEYFEQKLGDAGMMLDTSLADLDTLSACGRDCVAAIDAAAIFLKSVHAAYGAGGGNTMIVKQVCASTIECFWRG